VRKTVLLVAVAVLFMASFTSLSAQIQPSINAIEVKGLKRIEEGAVKAKISQKLGEPVSQEKTNEDIKNIFTMGYFEDVQAEIEAFEGGVKLIYVVKEKPTIIRVDFQGNKEIEDAKLKEKISVTPGSIADTVLIQDNATKIGKFYEEEGFWLTNVVPVVKRISQDEVSLTYQIDEGQKVSIKHIVTEGNKYLSSRQIKKVMNTKEWWLFSFITSTGYYKKEQMEADIEKIRNLYYNNGFLKVMIAEPEVMVDNDKKNMTIKIRISEGDQFSVAAVDFSGNTVFDNDTVRQKISLAPNTIFKKNMLERDMLSITELYSNNGYALASVVPDLQPDEQTRTVRVSLQIAEGDKYKMGRIEISGNTKTRDKVIRREIRVYEGETFDSSKLKRSYERINNLGFFDSVEMIPKPKYEDKSVDLDIKVKERPTGFLSVGGGYSSQDKFIATADVTQGNLFGRGQYIKLKGEFGGESSYYEFSFRDPYFLDTSYSFSTGIYKHQKDYIEYDKDAYGFYFGFGKAFREFWRGDITYNFEKADITNIDNDASITVKDQEGKHTLSGITSSVVRDSRDNYIDPTRGSRNALTLTITGLGGDYGYFKGLIDSGWYFPWGVTTFLLRGRFGYATEVFGKTLPLYERFYVGGLSTVRGLGFGDAGPHDPVTDEAIGGTTELIFNTEFIFPISPEMKLKGVVFFDAGKSYEGFNEFGSLRYTSGLGIRWISPFGPIRLDWGYNIDKEPGESSSKFEFAFGSFF